jgi:hypothetical protein
VKNPDRHGAVHDFLMVARRICRDILTGLPLFGNPGPFRCAHQYFIRCASDVVIHD